MLIEIFDFDGEDIVLNKPEVLLMKEFENVWKNTDWGQCKEDKAGSKHIKAMKFFKYLWLAHDYKSNYMELSKEERLETALKDSDLEEKDIKHGVAQVAIHKYEKLQETRLLQLLTTASTTIDKIRCFLDDIDLEEKDEKENYVHKTGDLLKQLTQLGSVASSLKDLEYQVKKEKESQKAVRGDNTEEGMFD